MYQIWNRQPNRPEGSSAENKVFDYKIGIVGPTRVGKTSVITALLTETKGLLAGTGASIKPIGATETVVADSNHTLNGSLISGEFNPGALASTEETFTYELALGFGSNQYRLRLALLDYPGGWIDAQKRPPERAADWDYCQQWLEESTVLIIPIDAALVMEASTGEQTAAALKLLQIELTANVVQDWIKSRIHQEERGLLLLVPVKCEKYFDDNGGRRDDSLKLLARVKQFCEPILTCVNDEVRGGKELGKEIDISIQYHPIDTIGCVELKWSKWIPTDNNTLRFEADYRVREPGKRQPLGAASLFIALCRHIMVQESSKQRNVFSNFWRWLRGQDQALLQVIQTLKEKPLSPRVKTLL